MRRDITVDNYLRELNRSLPGSARQRKRMTDVARQWHGTTLMLVPPV